MSLFSWIDGSTNFIASTKLDHIEDDYGPRLSYYDNATTVAINNNITKNSYFFYFR
ncbi:MAG: hypothetical protein VX590_00945 [Chloroflexota bacterium]|nr:hypothetical protein [Chloroflexota bacterium]